MKTTPGSREFSRWHQDQRVGNGGGLKGAGFQLLQQITGMHYLKTGIAESFRGFIIPVVTQHNPFFQGQQVAGIGPLLAGIIRELVIAGINKTWFRLAVQVVFADINQQVFQTIERYRVLRILSVKLQDFDLFPC
eukprot:Opistho-2@83644